MNRELLPNYDSKGNPIKPVYKQNPIQQQMAPAQINIHGQKRTFTQMKHNAAGTQNQGQYDAEFGNDIEDFELL